MVKFYDLTIRELRAAYEARSGNAVVDIFKDFFDISELDARRTVDSIVKYTKNLRDNLSLIVETNYVDKVYRDSYYRYYSTKLEGRERNCIKISFFEGDVDFEAFYDLDKTEDETKGANITDKYLGFMVIRPTPDAPVGRNVISPRALKNDKIRVCTAHVESTVSGVKMDVAGFPHSSQDSATMTCAETAIWALMEYYGNKYQEYRPTLPSRIEKALEKKTSQRQVPSNGLVLEDMAYTLKTYGFGPLVYEKSAFKDSGDFKKCFSCYVESGLPVVVSLRRKEDPYEAEGHAVLCIGRTDMDSTRISGMKLANGDKWNGMRICEWNANVDEFVFMDDNMVPYNIVCYSQPLAGYGDVKLRDYEINSFIVPLYHKIYLTAEDAMRVSSIIARDVIEVKENSVVRTFMTSSRSYKNYMLKKAGAGRELKEIVRALALPKFIYVTEMASFNRAKREKIDGFMILDATVSNIEIRDYKPLVMAVYDGKLFKPSKKSAFIDEYFLTLRDECNAFQGNLKLTK